MCRCCMGSTVISEASLSTIPAGWWPIHGGMPLTTYTEYRLDYQAMYLRHNNVKICVDFLARNMAHPGLHIYVRDDADNRSRLRDHRATGILKRPLPFDNKMTEYKLLEAVFSDMFISGNGYIRKWRNDDGELIGLLRVPYTMVSVTGVFKPEEYTVNTGRDEWKVTPGDMIHLRTYNPANNSYGVSPLESLREILAEEYENTKYSAKFWQNAARIGGVIERPQEAAEWTDIARANFRAQWESMYAGESNTGKTAVLEEGMKFTPVTWAPKDTLYIESRKLTREECARAYHIPPPMVGILDRATFSNIEAQNRSLYTDVLGPLFRSVEDDIAAQYLSEFPDIEGAYAEFNVEEKLQGDFEKQTNSFRQAVGVPYMTANEARARMNLPRIDSPEADQLVTPLNMSLPANYLEPNDGKADVDAEIKARKGQAPSLPDHEEKFPAIKPDFPELVEEYTLAWRKLMTRTFNRQREAVLAKTKAREIALVWDQERWDKELSGDIYDLSLLTASAFATATAEQISYAYNPEWMQEYLRVNSRIAAENLNASTMEKLTGALAAEDPLAAVKKVFDLLLAAGLTRFVEGRMTELENFAEYDVIDKSGLAKTKTWIVRSGNPRDTHAALNGVTVGIRDTFPNGAMWPGDRRAGPKETAYCQCKLAYGRAKK